MPVVKCAASKHRVSVSVHVAEIIGKIYDFVYVDRSQIYNYNQ